MEDLSFPPIISVVIWQDSYFVQKEGVVKSPGLADEQTEIVPRLFISNSDSIRTVQIRIWQEEFSLSWDEDL